MVEKLKSLEEKISGIASDLNLTIYDILYLKEGGYNYLQVFIEHKERDIELDDCVNFSNSIDEIVDTIFSEKFFLEVSSPGIEKKLRKIEHFKSVLGKTISVKTRSNIENKKRFKGELVEVLENSVIIRDDALEKDITIELDKINDAKLEYNIIIEEEE